MIKIIAEETGETRGGKIGVDMTVIAEGEIDMITNELGQAMFAIWKKRPDVIIELLEVLDDLIYSDLKE